MQTQKKLPNAARAIVTGKIVTVKKGQRIVREYQSGDPLEGQLPADDLPPFTGYVRGWFRDGGKKC